MSIKRPNPKKQGELGVAAAVNWFVQNGYVVSIPLVDSQRYDLVVDDGNQLQRVQVKTTTHKNRHLRYVVELRTMGGNRSGQTIKFFNPEEVELLFVLADDHSTYLVPSKDLRNKSTISLGPISDKYRVSATAAAVYSNEQPGVGTQVANEGRL
jgi:hypothetical protein